MVIIKATVIILALAVIVLALRADGPVSDFVYILGLCVTVLGSVVAIVDNKRKRCKPGRDDDWNGTNE